MRTSWKLEPKFIFCIILEYYKFIKVSGSASDPYLCGKGTLGRLLCAVGGRELRRAFPGKGGMELCLFCVTGVKEWISKGTSERN